MTVECESRRGVTLPVIYEDVGALGTDHNSQPLSVGRYPDLGVDGGCRHQGPGLTGAVEPYDGPACRRRFSRLVDERSWSRRSARKIKLTAAREWVAGHVFYQRCGSAADFQPFGIKTNPEQYSLM